MLELLSQIPLCATLVGLLGLYVGYLLAQESCKSIQKLQEDCSH